ncbi:hypothetical protein [uncultured Aquabacterium sp.]|jgi:ABC-type cobalt transport system substrate-binding protein|uniref:hypothetical protein n=1 Tax=Aquabacterium commune TaxID=70586 RepID=UPI0030D152FC|tara:strand:- start:778 stop:1032 length:255 start_codon:yes stop_codon:yes gene_type:complete
MKNTQHQRGNAVLVALIGLIGLVLSTLINRGYFDGKEEEIQAAIVAPEPASAPETAPEPTPPSGEEPPSEAAPAASDASASEPE